MGTDTASDVKIAGKDAAAKHAVLEAKQKQMYCKALVGESLMDRCAGTDAASRFSLLKQAWRGATPCGGVKASGMPLCSPCSCRQGHQTAAAAHASRGCLLPRPAASPASFAALPGCSGRCNQCSVHRRMLMTGTPVSCTTRRSFTWVDGQELRPGVAYLLASGCELAFGT